MKRTVLVSFLAIAALGLLVAFAYNSRSVPIEAHLAQHTISTDLERTQRDFELILETLNAAMDVAEAPPAGVESVRRRLAAGPERIAQEIERVPGSAAQTSRIHNYHERYVQSTSGADNLISNLISAQATYGESVRYLQEAGPGIVERMRAIGLERDAADTFQLIVGTVDFAARESSVSESELRRLHALLTRDQRLDSSMPAETERLLSAAETVVSSKRAILSRLDQLSVTPTLTNAANLAIAVNDAYGSAIAAADRARLMLAIYAVVLLIAVGLVGFRLKGSYADVNAVNAELAALNENLEQRVSERTEKLSAALRELKESQVQLVQAEKMSSLGQLVAGISHEINTPLLYLANNAELISERIELLKQYVTRCTEVFALDSNSFDNRDEYQKEFVNSLFSLKKMLQEYELEASAEEAQDLMADSIDGLGDLTEMAQSLKDFSRLDRAPVGSFDVNSGIDKTLMIARNIVKHKADVHKFYGDIPEIQCSPSKINQVFLNLITNAAQAIEQHGEIVIKTDRHGDDHVAISVSDSGCGISEENLSKIRDPFFTTKEVGTGTGLGLSIVDEIVRSHGGELKVESRVGEGSTFTVILPIKQAALAGPAVAAATVNPDVAAIASAAAPGTDVDAQAPDVATAM